MDTHLTTIGSTLDAIAQLHASAPSSSRNVYRPFTCAVLNTYKLDVLDYIRDADQVESNLFWYPPLTGGSNGNKGDEEKSKEAIIPVVTTRLPEPREFTPPTPLRKNVMEAEARGLVQFDARTLLKAAQRLLDNYHHAPRARKHIKALLKRNSELEKQSSHQNTNLANTESLILKLSQPEYRRDVLSSMSEKPVAPKDAEKDIRKLQDNIRRERMEILAIEQTTEDLLERRQKILSQKARTQSGKAVGKPRTSTSRVASRSGSVTPKPKIVKRDSPVSGRELQRSKHSSQTPEIDSDEAEMPAVYEPETSAAIDLEGARKVEGEERREEDVTVRRRSSVIGESHAGEEASVLSNEQEPSDELERICENIWSLFGDNLRYVAVDREGADYRETLRILQSLSMGGVNSGAGDGDLSTASSSNESQATAATTGSNSSSSSQLENAGPPSSTIAIAAHILYILLTTPSPHVMEFDDLKTAGETWWTSQGCKALKLSAMGREAPADIDDNSGSLASKAVYSLIAKKLLRLQFRVGKRIISFPAHIV